MVRLKMLPTLRRPFHFMHETLQQQGFHFYSSHDRREYYTKLQDSSTQEEYTLVVPVYVTHENECVLKLKKSYFLNEIHIPFHVMEAAISKLQEMADYLIGNQTIVSL